MYLINTSFYILYLFFILPVHRSGERFKVYTFPSPTWIVEPFWIKILSSYSHILYFFITSTLDLTLYADLYVLTCLINQMFENYVAVRYMTLENVYILLDIRRCVYIHINNLIRILKYIYYHTFLFHILTYFFQFIGFLQGTVVFVAIWTQNRFNQNRPAHLLKM